MVVVRFEYTCLICTLSRYPPVLCLGLSASKFQDDSGNTSASIGQMFAMAEKKMADSSTASQVIVSQAEKEFEEMRTQSGKRKTANCLLWTRCVW